MNFKVGDICEVLKGSEVECGTFVSAKGKYIKITLIDAGYYRYDILDNNKKTVDSCYACFKDKDLRLIGKKGLVKPAKPTRFIVRYDENNVDPYKEFTSEADLKDWLNVARSDSSIRFDSIVVFPVGEPKKVTTTFSLTKV